MVLRQDRELSLIDAIVKAYHTLYPELTKKFLDEDEKLEFEKKIGDFKPADALKEDIIQTLEGYRNSEITAAVVLEDIYERFPELKSEYAGFGNVKHLNDLKKLDLPKGEYAVFGSGPMAVHGLRPNRDLDIIVKQELWDTLSEEHDIISRKLKDSKKRVEYIKIEFSDIEIFREWPPFDDLDELIDEAEIIKDVPYVRLGYVRKWKNTRKSEKDVEDSHLIVNYHVSGPHNL